MVPPAIQAGWASPQEGRWGGREVWACHRQKLVDSSVKIYNLELTVIKCNVCPVVTFCIC